MSIKPYFWPETTYNVKPDKLETITELDKLEITVELNKLKVFTELDKLEVLLPTLEVLQEPTKPVKLIIKHSQGRPRKHSVTKNPVIKNYLTFTGISAKQ